MNSWTAIELKKKQLNSMIIHDSYRRPSKIRVVNSRLLVYEVVFGDGIGDVATDLMTRIAPKEGPLAKQFTMKAADVVKDKAIGTVGNLAGRAFQSIKERISRLIRRKSPPQKLAPVKLPFTEAMPANVSKVINSAANQKLAELAALTVVENPAISKAIQDNITANLIAGSVFR